MGDTSFSNRHRIRGNERGIRMAKVDLTQLTDKELQTMSKAAEKAVELNESIIERCFEESERRKLAKYPDIQKLARKFSKMRMRTNPSYKVQFQEWMGAYDVDGIKVGNTVDEAYQYLKSQVG
jgi:hypothetical protein